MYQTLPHWDICRPIAKPPPPPVEPGLADSQVRQRLTSMKAEDTAALLSSSELETAVLQSSRLLSEAVELSKKIATGDSDAARQLVVCEKISNLP